jgi:TP901 family phage tail tape measure protein
MSGASKVRAGQAFVEIGADPRKLFAALGKINQRIGKLGQSMVSMGSRMTAIGAAVAAPIALATRQFSVFDDAIRATAAVSGATGAALQSMNDRARELGATTSFTAVQVANLMTELGRAGFKPDEINAMTGAVLNLARATGTDAALSAGIMAATLRQFGLGATDAARAADVLTKAANATFNTVEGLGESLKFAGPVAKSLGMSLEDTVAVLGVLGNVGIQGSEAGTALRRLSVIAAGSGDELQKLFGVTNTDAAGNLKPLVDILDEINTATAGMPVAERTEKMAKAFGLLGITSANVLSSSAEGVRGLADQLRNAEGTAAKTAKEMDAGLGGAIRILLSAVEGTALAIGDALAPSMQKLAEIVTNVAGKVTQFVKENQGMVVGVAKSVAVFTAAGAGLVALGYAVKLTSFVFGGLLSAATLVVTTLVSTIATAASLAASFVAATAGVLTYSAASVAAAAASGAAWAIANAPLIALVGILGAVGVAAVQMMGGIDGITASVQGAFSASIKGATSLFGQLGEIAKETFAGIKAAFESGDLESAMKIAMDGVVAAFKAATSALLKNLDSTWANIQNTFDAMQAYAKQPLMMFEAIKDPFVEEDRKALRDRQDRRLAQVEERDAERQAKNKDAIDGLRGRVQNLNNGVAAASGERAKNEQFASLMKNIESASTIDQLRDLYGEYDALSQNGRLTSVQAQTISDALDDAQMRVSRNMSAGGGSLARRQPPPEVDAGQSQAEVAGTFSAAAVGGLGVGQSLAQKQLDELKGIHQELKNMEGGAVGD